MITKIVSKNFDIPNSHKLEVALANGRYSSIDKLFSMTPDDVIKEVTKCHYNNKYVFKYIYERNGKHNFSNSDDYCNDCCRENETNKKKDMLKI